MAFSFIKSSSFSFSVTTDSKKKEKADLYKTTASGISTPGVLDFDSEELESDSDSTDSVESDYDSLPDSELLDKKPSSNCQTREGAIDASRIPPEGSSAD